jgi:hypothetical protein
MLRAGVPPSIGHAGGGGGAFGTGAEATGTAASGTSNTRNENRDMGHPGEEELRSHTIPERRPYSKVQRLTF